MPKMLITSDFTEAVNDYKYFAEKNYPEKAVLKIIGDRYRLSGTERSILFRGIYGNSNSLSRKRRLLKPEDIYGNEIFIDGYNVLITTGSYLSGKVTFIGTDGLLRDAAESHGKINKNRHLEKSLLLILEFLSGLKVKSVNFYFDSPVSNSGVFSVLVNKNIAYFDFKGTASCVDSPDHVLKNVSEGIICTSDSAVIDNSKVRIFDLARHALENRYHPDFIFL
jgi:hypothetical protein